MAPADSRDSRKYEIVVYGATGYTGKYTAEHIHATGPKDLKWAIAGRNAKKLEAVLAELKKANPSRPLPAVETIQHDEAGLHSLAKQTKVLITTVGPYALYGSPVVQACVKAGTHYLDVTGEIPWVRNVISDYHATAGIDKTAVIPQCGVESAPSDVLAYALVRYAQEHYGEGLKECINSTQKINNGLSGGTVTTALGLMDVYPMLEVAKSLQPFALADPELKPSDHQYKTPGAPNLLDKAFGYVRVPELGGRLTDWPFNTCDRAQVHRSWSLHDNGRLYGPNFRFAHLKSAPNLLYAIVQAGLMRMLPLMLIFPPARWLLRRLAHIPGEGPSRAETERMFARYKALGVSQSGRRITADLFLKGSMYYWTGVFVSEAAIVLARSKDNLASRKGGVLTPSTLEGEYLERLKAVGVDIKIKALL